MIRRSFNNTQEDNSVRRSTRGLFAIMLTAFICFSFLLSSTGCDTDDDFSPWQSNPAPKDLTKKHLRRLAETDIPSFEPFNVAVIADSQIDLDGLKTAIRRINNYPDVDFVLFVGDLTEHGLQQEFLWVKKELDDLKVPVLTVIGNHDGISNGGRIYQRMFGPLNYTFIYRDTQFIMWNNNPYEFGAPDLDWLRTQVGGHYRNVIVSHQPPYAGPMTASQEAEWKAIRSDESIIASVQIGRAHV